MDHFTSGGVFWLPDHPLRRSPGDLTFDAQGVQLQLHDSMEEFVESPDGIIGVAPEWKTFAIVHGQLHDDREVSLIAVTGISLPGPFNSAHEAWSAEFALVGGFIDVTEFEHVQMEFDALMAWASPESIAREGETRNSVVVGFGPTATLAEAHIGTGAKLRLLTGGRGSWNDQGVHIEQWCAFEVATGPVPLRSILDDWVRPLQDLLIVCLGRPVRLTALRVRAGGHDGQSKDLEVSFAAVQPPSASPLKPEQVQVFNAPTLLTPANAGSPLEDLLRNWFEVRDSHSAPITLVCGPYYAPFIYGEHRYASTFQAAEALARELYGSRELSKRDHRKRADAVLRCLLKCELDREVVDWARRVLEPRNDKPLQALMSELIAGTGALGATIHAVDQDFPKQLTTARTGVSHGGAKGANVMTRFWLGDILTWVVRVQLLSEMGIPVATLAQRVLANPRFKRALREAKSAEP